MSLSYEGVTTSSIIHQPSYIRHLIPSCPGFLTRYKRNASSLAKKRNVYILQIRLAIIYSAEYFTDDEFNSLKAAIEREENQACLSYPEREQARPKVNADNDELLKLLTSIIKTTKEKDDNM